MKIKSNIDDMAESDRNKKAEEIGEKIRAIMEAKKWTQADLGRAYGATPNTITKMLGGSVKQWAKLAFLAKALGTDPNEILGFPTKADWETEQQAARQAEKEIARETVRGIIEAVTLHHLRPLDEAVPLGEAVAAAIDSHEVRNRSMPPRDNARKAASDAISEFFLPKWP